MRIAILSDIHGNLEAFKTVLGQADMLGAEAVYSLGDLVGYGPNPDECVEIARERCMLSVMGNHDAGMCGKLSLDHFDPAGKKALQKTQQSMKPENLEYLSGLPMTAVAGDVMLVHSSPHRPEAWTYIHSPEDAAGAFGAFRTPLCFVGHTHVPAIIGENLTFGVFSSGMRLIVNVGSVGQPRNGDPRATFGLLDTGERSYDQIRIEYDVRKTATAIRRGGLPPVLADRLEKGW